VGAAVRCWAVTACSAVGSYVLGLAAVFARIGLLAVGAEMAVTTDAADWVDGTRVQASDAVLTTSVVVLSSFLFIIKADAKSLSPTSR